MTGADNRSSDLLKAHEYFMAIIFDVMYNKKKRLKDITNGREY